MSTILSRRIVFGLGAGVGALAATVFAAPGASAAAQPAEASKNVMIVRRWQKLWAEEKTDWAPFDAMLTDDFTFSSAAPDDHINKAAYKTTCWDTQIAHIKGADLELVMAQGDSVFVKYLAHTVDGASFRNVELYRLRDDKIASIECYFGGPGYPTAADSHKT